VEIPRQVSPRFATRCVPQHKSVVDDSGMIRTQMGSTIHQ